jgi:hypothetical protein
MFKSFVYAAFVLSVFSGCADQRDPLEPTPSTSASVVEGEPAGLTAVAVGSGHVVFWPFTSSMINGPESDPINLIFPSRDARDIRASLLFLNGDRTAFGLPNTEPFNCVWKEAVGGAQVTYARETGWTGSAIQLECGDFAPMRFHLRLFPAGTSTIANVHFEVVVPGTNQHEVLSWELAEQLIKVDFLRSGLVSSIAQTQQINPAPTFRSINPLIYNSLPASLRELIGGPGIATDGRASVITLARTAESEPMLAKREFVITFNQIIPKPFCASGPFDYILVQGPITVRQTVHVTASGNYLSRYHASGSLDLTPVNPLTREVIGETYRAQVNDIYKNVITDNATLTSNLQLQMMIPSTGPFRGSLHASLHVGPGGSSSSTVEARCD